MDPISVIITALLVVISLALIGLILIQRGKGGGLAGVFGGGSVEQAFGTHAATMAQKATAILGVLFIILTVSLAIRKGGGTYLGAGETSPAPVQQTAPAMPAAPTQLPAEGAQQ